MKIIISFIAVLLFISPAFAQHKIKAEDAKNHVTQTDTVTGKIEQVKTTASTIYLNIGGKYPDNPFSAIIFIKNRDLFPDVNTYEGKNVEVIGIIQLYKDKPEIILNDPKQLIVVSQ